MGDTPGVCTRLRAKRMSLSLMSPKDSSDHGRKIRNCRLPSVSKTEKVNSLSSIKQKSTLENENDASKNSPKKSRVSERQKNEPESFSGISTDENLVLPSSSSGLQSSPMSLRPRLSSAASNSNTSSASAKKQSLHKRKIKIALESSESEESDKSEARDELGESDSESLISLSVLTKSDRRKKLEKNKVPQTKVGCTSGSDDSSLEASPLKKRKTSVCGSVSVVKNSTAGIEELVAQDDVGDSLTSSGEKDISSRSNAVPVDVSIALEDDKKEEICKSCGESSPSSIVSSSFQVTSLHNTIQSVSVGNKSNVTVSLQKLSPSAVSLATKSSQQSIPSKVGHVTEMIIDGYSSDNTFEEIAEKTEEEIITSVNPKQEKLSTSKNLGRNLDGLSSLETVALDDSSTSPCSTNTGKVKTIEENKCSTDEHKNENSIKPSSSDPDLQVIVTDVSSDKSSSSLLSSKNDSQNLVDTSTNITIVPEESEQLDGKMQTTAQSALLSPKSSNKSVISSLHTDSDKGSKSKHKPHAKKSFLVSGSCNKPKSENSVATTSDKQKGEQNGQKNKKMAIVCDEVSSLDDGMTRTSGGALSVSDDNTKITYLITLDSDESSEFSVSEVKAGKANKQNGKGMIRKSVGSDQDIIIRSVAEESEEKSTDDEGSVNETKDNEIKIIEVDTVGKEEKLRERLQNKVEKEEPENMISSLQNTVLNRQCCLNLYKEIISKNKLLEKNLILPKTSLHNLGDRKSDDKTFKMSKKLHLNTEETRHESDSVSNRILSPNFESKYKKGNLIQSNENVPQKLTNKLKKINVAANKVIEVNVDISSSDVEIIHSDSVLNTSKSKLKVKCKSSLSGSKTLSGSVGVKSRILGKQKRDRTEVNVEESLQSDSDAELRKNICQKAKMRIAESVAESTGSTSKQATSDNEGSASAPDNANFVARPRLTLESLARGDRGQHQKQLLKLKRLKRLKMLKQQKEEKLNRLKESMASKEDASCSSSESSAEEHEKRNTMPYVHDGFLVSPVNQVAKQERISGSHPVVKKKKKMDPVSRAVAAAEKLSCRATSQWVIEDLSRSSHKLRRLPESVVGKLTNHRPKISKPAKESSAKDQQTRIKRKQWKDTGVTVSGFNVTTDADFIPLKTGTTVQFGVMPLNKMLKAAPAFAKDSANFRHNMMYGNHIQREPAKVVLDRQLKLKAGGKDGLVRFSHL